MAGRPIEEVPIMEYLNGGLTNWCMRLIAACRPATVEVFRTRQEAIFASLLIKALRDAQIDMNLILKGIDSKHSDTIHHDGQKDLTDWPYRFKLLNKAAGLVSQHMRSYLPAVENSEIMARIQQLELENQRLRAAGPNTSAAPSTEPSEHAQLKAQFKPYERGDSRQILAQGPSTGSNQAVNGWVRSKVVGAAKERMDKLLSELKDVTSSAPAGVLPDLQATLVDWGLSVEVAAALNGNETAMLKLLSGAAALRA